MNKINILIVFRARCILLPTFSSAGRAGERERHAKEKMRIKNDSIFIGSDLWSLSLSIFAYLLFFFFLSFYHGYYYCMWVFVQHIHNIHLKRDKYISLSPVLALEFVHSSSYTGKTEIGLTLVILLRYFVCILHTMCVCGCFFRSHLHFLAAFVLLRFFVQLGSFVHSFFFSVHCCIQ